MVINREKRTMTVIEIIPAENIHKDFKSFPKTNHVQNESKK